MNRFVKTVRILIKALRWTVLSALCTAGPGLAAAPEPGTVFRDCAVCPEMVVVPAGAFTIGSPGQESERYSPEGPQYRVTISKPFAIGRFEVTFAEWDACVADGGCRGYRPPDEGWGRGNRPVIHVNRWQTRRYFRWLSRKTGQPYRLPSETEWEYAARAGTTTPFWFGDALSTDRANYNGTFGYEGRGQGEFRRKTVPVGSFAPNPFGLFDTHGNVWEWVADCWSGAYYMGRSATEKRRPGRYCEHHVVRGGSWNTRPGRLRSAHRFPRRPQARRNDIGFRVARDLPDADQAAP